MCLVGLKCSTAPSSWKQILLQIDTGTSASNSGNISFRKMAYVQTTANTFVQATNRMLCIIVVKTFIKNLCWHACRLVAFSFSCAQICEPWLLNRLRINVTSSVNSTNTKKFGFIELCYRYWLANYAQRGCILALAVDDTGACFKLMNFPIQANSSDSGLRNSSSVQQYVKQFLPLHRLCCSSGLLS